MVAVRVRVLLLSLLLLLLLSGRKAGKSRGRRSAVVEGAEEGSGCGSAWRYVVVLQAARRLNSQRPTAGAGSGSKAEAKAQERERQRVYRAALPHCTQYPIPIVAQQLGTIQSRTG